MNTMDDLDRRPTEFELYGNQPRVHAIAFKVRLEINDARRHSKDAMRRCVNVNGHNRVSGRPTGIDDYFIWTNVRRVGRSCCSSAPKSATKRWLLAAGGFECCPF